MQEQNQTTATLMVMPGQDSAVIALGDEIVKLAIYAQALTIDDNEDMNRATNDLALMSGLKKSLEEKRKEYLSPLQHHVKEVNGVFKLLTEPLEAANTMVKQKMLVYKKKLDDERAEQQRINDMRMEASEREMRLKGEMSEPVGLVDVSPPAPTRVQTDVGTVGTAKIKKWEIEDFSKVPDEYKMPDAAKIGKVVRAGIPSIAGVRIYEEESMRVTLRG